MGGGWLEDGLSLGSSFQLRLQTEGQPESQPVARRNVDSQHKQREQAGEQAGEQAKCTKTAFGFVALYQVPESFSCRVPV